MADRLGITVLNYLDDLCSVSLPQDSAKNYQVFSNLLNDLGLLESEEKSVPPGTQVEFLGVLFNTVTQTMEVTPNRLKDISSLVLDWLNKTRASKRQLQSLIGKFQVLQSTSPLNVLGRYHCK